MAKSKPYSKSSKRQGKRIPSFSSKNQQRIQGFLKYKNKSDYVSHKLYKTKPQGNFDILLG